MGNMRIRTRVLLICILISVIPILLLGGTSFVTTRGLLQTRARNTMNQAAARTRNVVDNYVANVEYTLTTIAYSTTVAQMIGADYTDSFAFQLQADKMLIPLLSILQGQNRDYSRISLYTENRAAAYSYFIHPLEDADDTVSPALNTTLPYWYISSNAVRASKKLGTLTTSKMTHIISISIDIGKFYRLFDDSASNYILLSEDGNVLRTNLPISPDDPTDFQELVSESGEQGVRIRIDEEDYLMICTEFNLPGLKLCYLAPYGETFASTEGILITTVIFALTAILFSMLISIFFSTALSASLNRLLEAFRKVEEGSLNADIENNNRDEIGELTRRFRHMIERLKVAQEDNRQIQIRAREAEMRALQAQINPHFLYNTLSMINWKAIEYGADELGEAVRTLSTFYRTALNRGADMTTLDQEIVNVQAYVSIRKLMSNNSFEFVLEMDEDEKLKKCRVINLMLQPIVENAIDHGIGSLSEREGLLTLHIGHDDKDSKNVAIRVTDNGSGIPEEKLQNLLTEASTGYGLRNVNERLKYYFGSDAGLYITSVPGKGTCVEVRGVRC